MQGNNGEIPCNDREERQIVKDHFAEPVEGSPSTFRDIIIEERAKYVAEEDRGDGVILDLASRVVRN